RAELPRRRPDHRRQHHAQGRRHQRSIACRKLWKARGIAKAIWPNEWLLVLLTAIAHHTFSCIRLKLWPSKNAMADDKVEHARGAINHGYRVQLKLRHIKVIPTNVAPFKVSVFACCK